MPPHRLLLIRHAKAGDGSVDADRPLTEKGLRRATAIGTWLESNGLVPDRVLVSPARRAGQTWEQAAAQLASAPDPVVEERIYDNTVEALLAAIRETPDDVRTLAVLGHNPSIGSLAAEVDDGEGSQTARRDLHAGFPTGAVAVFDLVPRFADVAADTATLAALAVPGD
ncbi:MAG TPA: histidine phosphatase family protein [Blastococcus sp.]|nr:histidine phosphatase family protein [Blastococcus sp.]